MSKALLRIGFDGSRSFINNRTGTENYSYQLLKNLAKIDTENQYLIYLREDSKVSDKFPDNFKFKVIKQKKLWTQIGLSKQTFIDPLDILFTPAHTLPLGIKPGIKTIVTIHDLGSEYLPKTHQLKQFLYLKWITKFQLKKASKIIAVSNATKLDLVKKAGIDSKKIEVIYEGVDREVFRVLSKDEVVKTLKSYGLEYGNYFLFVGTIQPRKNLERLIKAFLSFSARGPAAAVSQVRPRELTSSLWSTPEISHSATPLAENNQLKLVLVGNKGWMSDQIYKLPKKLGINERVKFLGRVEDQDLVSLYNGAAGLVYPSLFEGFGLPILEAFACHCPVLTSNTSSMPEIAGRNGSAILIDAYDIESIKKGMEELLNKNIRESLIDQGSTQLEKFSWEKCAKETLKLFKEVYANR